MIQGKRKRARASEREREIERRRAEAKGWLEKAVKSGARFGSLDRGTREERLSDGGRWPRGGGGGVQSVRGKERRARRCRVTERRESECHWRCIQPAAKTVLRHLDPLSGRVARADRECFLDRRIPKLTNCAKRRNRSLDRSIRGRSTVDELVLRPTRAWTKIWQQCEYRGEECKKSSHSKKRCYETFRWPRYDRLIDDENSDGEDDDDDDDSTWLILRRYESRRERSPVSFHGLEKSHFTRP